MFNPEKNYLDYGVMLKPPVGFKLSKALALTYSLDLDTLVSIPIALHFSQTLDLKVETSVVQLLDAIVKTKDVLKVVFQKGQMTVKNTDHYLHSLLKDSVIHYTPKPNTSFHPKCWVIRYTNAAFDVKYRLIVLSRNMTFDDSWDVAFTIDGDLTQKKNKTKEIKPLIDLIAHIQSHTELSGYEDFLEDLLYIKWDTQNENISISDFEIQVSGIKDAAGFDLFDMGEEMYRRTFIASPFLTPSLLNEIVAVSFAKPILVSRKYEIDCKLSKEQLGNVDAYILNDEQIFSDDVEEEGCEPSPIDTLQSDVHAKLYVMDERDERTTWIYLGSANATHKGHYANVELMVKIHGKTKQMGVEIVKSNLLNDNTYFVPYKTKDMLSSDELSIAQAERELDTEKQQILDATIQGTYTLNDKGKYDLIINSSPIKFSKNILVTLRPIYMVEEGEKSLAENVQFHQLEEQQLTAFIAFKIRHEKVTDACARNFVLKVDTIGLPPDMDKIIFRKIISDPANFMRYLRFLLAEDYWEGIAELDGSRAMKKLFGESGASIFVDDQPIYEALLKAYSREPHKLDDIQMAIEKLNDDENVNDKIVPPEFYQMWQRIYFPKRKKK
jgi:hypothetical protein